MPSEDQIARGVVQSESDFFDTELSLVKTLLDVAENRYSMGHIEEGHRAKQEALTAIHTVRRFLEKAHLIGPDIISKFHRRCDELQLLVNSVEPTK